MPRCCVAVLILLLLGACTDGSSDSSWVEAARVSPTDLPDDVRDDGELPATVSCEPLGVEEPAAPAAAHSASQSDTVERGVGNDPFTATGARQVPGPDMARMAPPSEPVAVVVARPVDPDEHVAARQPDGVATGPVPPPRYTPGVGSTKVSDEPPASTTEPDDDEVGQPDAASAPCVPLVGP